ncbi:NAD-dependent succinate-semialdehyde dehydrogenase [Pseudogracilibacillus sp. SE30717A]|uniref:NAD-dependent succinate-semialdehyde dehydrogenase n=1 Tax=Pseudogracilibacillus sp. SE30717A TaxID=3098293 RepID=UPI00300DEBEA
MYINGKKMGEDLEKIEIMNPATNEVIGKVPNGGEKEAEQAIKAAYEAFLTWSETTAYERAAYLKRLNKLIIEHQEELAQTMTMEMGKPIEESKGEVVYGASFLEWYAEEAKRVYGETIPTHISNKRLQVWKKPVGVVAAITPWNFPLAMITRKIAPALAAGCTVIIKPSKESPLTAIKLMELVEKAGIPEGVVNLVTGSSAKIVGQMMENDKVRKITFTGSTEIGKLLIEQSAKQVKRLSLELGGHAPFIILDDANVEKAVDGVLASKFRNGGQTCVCANRIYVQAGIYEQFVNKFSEKVKGLRVGNSLHEEKVDIGPLINEDGVNKVARHVKDAVEKGALIVTGGNRIEGEGTFYEPTVLRDIDPSMIIMQEETFGPVAPIQKIETDEEAVELANSTEYGLAAYVFTESVSRGTKLVEKLDFGIVGWNDGVPSAAQAPFGGMKESGIGREGGHEGMDAFLETQYVSIGLS